MLSDDGAERLNSYVKLNVGGALFYTTIGTLLSGQTMLHAMFSGRMEVKTDDDGWVLIDRSGKHFGTLLNYIRDGSVPLPENRRDLEELLIEARYFCVDGLRQACEDALSKLTLDDDLRNRATIIIVKCPNAAKSLLSTAKKPVVKLTMNRYNNVFSYTSNSHDNLLRNVECLEKYALMFPDMVLFVKDVRDKSEQNEICEWSYYCRGHRLKSIDCIAIHYSSEKRLIKVEFPESRIHEEMLSLLSVSNRKLSDAELRDLAIRKANCATASGSGPPYSTIQSSLLHEQDEPPDSDQASTAALSVQSQSFSGPPPRPVTLSAVLLHSDSAIANQPVNLPTTMATVVSTAPTAINSRAPFGSSVRLGRRG